LRSQIEQELERRAGSESSASPPPPPSSSGGRSLTEIKGILSRWYHELCLRYHGDRGGSDEQMKVLNHAYSRLKEMIGA
jgi:hypothetical protein